VAPIFGCLLPIVIQRRALLFLLLVFMLLIADVLTDGRVRNFV